MKTRILQLTVQLIPHKALRLRSPGTTIRGALGLALCETGAVSLFENLTGVDVPRPSGFADIPRPFVIRSEHIQDICLPPGQPFSFFIHLFDLRQINRPALRETLNTMACGGLGPDRVACSLGELTWVPLSFELPAPVVTPNVQLTLEFHTPLDLRLNNQDVPIPEFPILIARLRDRISALNSFYGDAPLHIDYARFTDIAKSVHLISHRLAHRSARRHSTRTGQWHPMSGIVGTAIYEGPWRAYYNWLRLGEWTGVGKQTSFGKGAFRIVPEMEPVTME